MSTIQERIKTALSEHEHHFKLTGHTIDDGVLYCDCEKWEDDSCAQHENHRAHVAAMLTPLIREAQAQVLIEFADGHRIPTPMFQGRTMRVTVNDLLRAKAAELRSPAIVGPDCRDNKHRACDGTALDEVLDEIIHCQCPCHQ